MRSLFLVAVVMLSAAFPLSAYAGTEQVSGIYENLTFLAQKSPVNGETYGLGGGIGIRFSRFSLGIDVGQFFLANPSSRGFATSFFGETLLFAKAEFLPIGGLKLTGLWGPGLFWNAVPQGDGESRAYAVHYIGGRISYEWHTTATLSIEPGFTVLQDLATNKFDTYLFTLSFGLWNEAFFGSGGRRGFFHFGP